MTSHRKDKRLSVLTDAEKFALYGLPDFDESQQLEFLSLSTSELELATNRPGLQAQQVYCILQIGYFKAKRAFFRFTLSEVESDCEFVLSRYFRHIASFKDTLIANHEYYAQRKLIAELLGYSLWSEKFRLQLEQQAAQIVRRDVTPGFVATELIIWLNEQHIIRPRYSTLQELISSVLSAERRRLGDMLAASLDESACMALSSLLKSDDTLSQLAALKQDAKDFGWRQMVGERKKCFTLAPIYQIARTLLPVLGISRQNLLYYASLANFYTVRDLRDLKADQTRLYLLCYAWVRYRQLTDNLVDATFFHMRQLEAECRAEVQRSLSGDQERHSKEIRQVGRLLSLYVDERVADQVPFGEVRKRAWKIMSRDVLQSTAQRMSVKPVSKLALHWKAVDGLVDRIRRHLRPLYATLNFVGINVNSPWLMALDWAKCQFIRQPRGSQWPFDQCLDATLPKRLRPYLLIFDEKGEPTGIQAHRYEFWLYRQIRKRFEAGEIYLNDSLQHRRFSDELVSRERTAALAAQMDIPFLRQPVEEQLDTLMAELNKQWRAFNRELKKGRLKHLEYDENSQTLGWRKSKCSGQLILATALDCM